MVRYSMFILAVLGSAATAIAAITPSATDDGFRAGNITVVEKNQAFPQLGPLITEDCMTEDCSDVAS